MAHHPSHPGGTMGGHLDHYSLTNAHSAHSSATKPRSRSHLEMDSDSLTMGHPHHAHHPVMQPSNHHHQHHPHHHHPPPHHVPPLHQPPTKVFKGSDYDSLMGKPSLSMPQAGGMMTGHPPVQGGAQNSLYGTGLGPTADLMDMTQSRHKPERDDSSQGSADHSMAGTHNPESVLPGAPGMPQAMPRPRGPKLKFTPEDDALLVNLKEERGLTWKQIAEFFPGRTSGTLQVRYCTKLKAKTTQWTDEMVQRLQNAIQEYEQDRWRLVASKVGNGFSPAACQEKSKEMSMGTMESMDSMGPVGE